MYEKVSFVGEDFYWTRPLIVLTAEKPALNLISLPSLNGTRTVEL
jgi:hypothetical protein